MTERVTVVTVLRKVDATLETVGLFITNVVATMWCAIAFALLALVSLPAAITGGVAPLIAWIAQTFLQLVLLSIIMVGQKLQATRTDDLAARADDLVEQHRHTHRLLTELHAHHLGGHTHD